jgi:hypothetical protein
MRARTRDRADNKRAFQQIRVALKAAIAHTHLSSYNHPAEQSAAGTLLPQLSNDRLWRSSMGTASKSWMTLRTSQSIA